MRKIATAALLALGLTAPALASPPGGGVIGHIVDGSTGKPLAGVALEVFRMPVQRGDMPVKILKSNKRGFFADVVLPPGRYIFATAVVGLKAACEVDDIYDGSQTTLKLAVSDTSAVCTGPGVHTAIVNAALTSDVTIVH